MISRDAVCVRCWWCGRYLSNNNLTSTLPTELGLLTKLRWWCVHLAGLCCVCTLGYWRLVNCRSWSRLRARISEIPAGPGLRNNVTNRPCRSSSGCPRGLKPSVPVCSVIPPLGLGAKTVCENPVSPVPVSPESQFPARVPVSPESRFRQSPGFARVPILPKSWFRQSPVFARVPVSLESRIR